MSFLGQLRRADGSIDADDVFGALEERGVPSEICNQIGGEVLEGPKVSPPCQADVLGNNGPPQPQGASSCKSIVILHCLLHSYFAACTLYPSIMTGNHINTLFESL